MKYPYTFKQVANHFIMDLPEHLNVVTLLLMDIESLGGDASYWLKAIDNVLEGRSVYEDSTGNAITTEITKITTTVINNYPAYENDDQCIIETTELKEIILIWLEEFRRFNAQKAPNC